MAKYQLPASKDNHSPEEGTILSQEEFRRTRVFQTLRVTGIIMALCAASLLALSHYTVVSLFLAMTGVIIFFAGKLVQKSLALTATSSRPQADSTVYKLELVRRQVSKCKFLENTETEGMRAATQAELLVHQYKQLRHALEQKFNTSEITFHRYSEGINASCLAIGESLLHTKSILENLNLFSELNQNKEQKNQVSELLSTTEKALDQLTGLFQALNEVNTNEKFRDQLEQSMQQIRELASRAQIYSKH